MILQQYRECLFLLGNLKLAVKKELLGNQSAEKKGK